MAGLALAGCDQCARRPQYRDRQTRQYACLEHARLEVTAGRPLAPGRPLTVRPAVATDHSSIQQLALYFWDETIVDAFDRQYDVLHCPAFLACDDDQVVGLAAYAIEAIKKERIVPISEVWDAIEERLYQAEAERVKNEWISELKKKAYISIKQ